MKYICYNNLISCVVTTAEEKSLLSNERLVPLVVRASSHLPLPQGAHAGFLYACAWSPLYAWLGNILYLSSQSPLSLLCLPGAGSEAFAANHQGTSEAAGLFFSPCTLLHLSSVYLRVTQTFRVKAAKTLASSLAVRCSEAPVCASGL